MLYREIIAVCSQIHTKHINTLCGQNVELLNVKSGGTQKQQNLTEVIHTECYNRYFKRRPIYIFDHISLSS